MWAGCTHGHAVLLLPLFLSLIDLNPIDLQLKYFFVTF